MIQDIARLRKEGKPAEALAVFRTMQAEGQAIDFQTEGAAAWVYYDLLKAAKDAKDIPQAIELLDELSNFKIDLTNEHSVRLLEQVEFIVGGLLFDGGQSNPPDKRLPNNLAEKLVKALTKLPTPPTSENHGKLLNYYLRNTGQGFHDALFFQWWGLANLPVETYAMQRLADGQDKSPIAEQGLMRYARALFYEVRREDWKDEGTRFLDYIEKVIAAHPRLESLQYQALRLRMALGRVDEARELLPTVARRLSKQPMLWSIVAELAETDIERLAAFCKGLSLKGQKEEFLAPMRREIVPVLVRMELFDEARTEVDFLIATAIGAGRQPKKEELTHSQAEWYPTAEPKPDNRDLYNTYAPMTDRLLASDLKEVVAVVTAIAPSKKTGKDVIYWRASRELDGNLSADRAPEGTVVGQTLLLRAAEKQTETGVYLQVQFAEATTERPNADTLKFYSGVLSRRPEAQFGFVDREIFVARDLLVKAENNALVAGQAIAAYDQKKGWGWRAITLEPA